MVFGQARQKATIAEGLKKVNNLATLESRMQSLALVQMADDRTLVDYLEDPKGTVQQRQAIVGEMGYRKGKQFLPILSKVAGQNVPNKNPQDRTARLVGLALRALGVIGGIEARAVVRKQATSSNLGVRSAALIALGDLRNKSDFEVVFAQRKHPSPLIRQAVARSIRFLGTAEHAPTLLFLAKDPDPDVRRLAATSLGYLRVRSALPTLHSLLKDRSSTVAQGAINGVLLLGDRSSIPHLKGLIRPSGPGPNPVSTQAESAISRLENPKALEQWRTQFRSAMFQPFSGPRLTPMSIPR
jgi:HEAT repeat protein